MSGSLSSFGPERVLASPISKMFPPPKVALLLALLSLLAPLRAHAQDKAPDTKAKASTAVTVLPFVPPRDYWYGAYYWYESGGDMAMRVEDKLRDRKNPVRVVERQYMGELDKEKMLGYIGNTTGAAQFGQASGAQIMIIGSIDQLFYTVRGYGPFKQEILHAKITGRIVDIQTTEILKVVSNIEGKDDKGIKVDLGILKNPFNEKQIGLVNNPYHKALENAAGKLADKIEEFLQTYTPPPGKEPVNSVAAGPICWTREMPTDAQITGNHADAVAAAQRKAVQDALHRAVALYLSPETRKREEAKLQERIYNSPDRFAKIEGTPIGAKDDNGVYRASMKVSVFLTDPNEGDCRALPTMLKEMGLNPKIKGRVAVVISETHLQRRVPDPAVETAIQKKLNEACFQLADPQRVMKLRSMDWSKMMAQGSLPPSDLEQFRSDLGADVEYMIWGEAFSQGVANQVISKSAARAEVKITRLSDGSLIHSDSVPDVTATGSTEEIAGKQALEKAGSILSSKVVTDFINNLPEGPDEPDNTVKNTHSCQVVIRGWKKYAETTNFLKKLKGVAGITLSDTPTFEAPVLTMKVETKGDAAALAEMLSSEETLKPFHIEVTSVVGSKIEATYDPDAADSPAVPKGGDKPKTGEKPKGSAKSGAKTMKSAATLPHYGGASVVLGCMRRHPRYCGDVPARAGTSSAVRHGGDTGGKSYAIVVTVSQYPIAAACLPDSYKDGERFLKALGVPGERTLFLCDENPDTRLRPTRSNILAALKRLAAQTRKGDTIWFYFSGHGQYKDRASNLIVTSQGGIDALRIGDIRQVLENPRLCMAHRRILVIDACESGSAKSLQDTTLDTVFGKSEPTIIMTAAQNNESAWVFKGIGSVFTYVLAREMAGYSATANSPWITYDRLRRNVRLGVQDICNKNNGAQQKPYFYPYSIRDGQPLAKRNEALLALLNDAGDAELEARPTLHPGLIVLLSEQHTRRNGTQTTSRYAQTALEGVFTQEDVPVLAEEAVAPFLARLRDPNAAIAAKQAEALSALLLLRGEVEVEEVDSYVPGAVCVTATASIQLIDVAGNVLATFPRVPRSFAGNGTGEAAAAQYALEKLKQALVKELLPTIQEQIVLRSQGKK